MSDGPGHDARGAMTGRAMARAFDPRDPNDVAGLIALFERSHCPCFCRYWHFGGEKNEWLARCALEPDESRAELARAAAEGSTEARGVVALEPPTGVVGWLKLAPALSLPKLYGQRFYRGLPAFATPREGVMTVGCLLVDPAFRRRHIAHGLVAGAVTAARAAGARSVEALPRSVGSEVSDEELWQGPEGAFVAAGFELVYPSAPYPVYRIDLG